MSYYCNNKKCEHVGRIMGETKRWGEMRFCPYCGTRVDGKTIKV